MVQVATRSPGAGAPRNRLPPSYSSMASLLFTTLQRTDETLLALYSYLVGVTICLFLNSSVVSCIVSIASHITLVYLTLTELTPTLLSFLPQDIPYLSHTLRHLSKSFQSLTEAKLAVIARAYALGVATGLGRYILAHTQTWPNFGLWLCVLSFFHFSEYFFTAISNPQNLGIKSFVLDHSREYHAAACAAILEYILERFLFPSFKLGPMSFFNWLGFFLCFGGEVFRKLAMITCGTNFNHLVEYRKREDHVLVVEGVYGLVRHPSYVGWFVWSVGTQFLLGNPICIGLYAYASWLFFNERIPDEEMTLIDKFGKQYVEYKQRVPLGIPFIKA